MQSSAAAAHSCGSVVGRGWRQVAGKNGRACGARVLRTLTGLGRRVRAGTRAAEQAGKAGADKHLILPWSIQCAPACGSWPCLVIGSELDRSALLCNEFNCGYSKSPTSTFHWRRFFVAKLTHIRSSHLLRRTKCLILNILASCDPFSKIFDFGHAIGLVSACPVRSQPSPA